MCRVEQDCVFLFRHQNWKYIMKKPETYRELGPEECRVFLEGVDPDTCMILDVRTPDEYASCHIRGSVNENFFSPDFRNNISKRDRGKRYLVYCTQGTRGSRTMNLMRDLGFSDVTNIRGGISAWQDAGLPVEK